ncbi:MAG: carbohydrate ABC transporter permease [Candidatus Enterosoma sp.]|nr:carbohydrate ABC transporter permease [Bacilli bacterium]MDD7081024.1 carbohydrate ABC transporter permease [bacterium]MDY4187798.1 carbohydrate ABC transporter permease [Candidatus Enterosoma sp.]MCI7065550.1 carbohydrate ABC transporter permease [Bacilli bacterium]MDD7572172.1 carbohydrate ABC transporter permease [bacterium]
MNRPAHITTHLNIVTRGNRLDVNTRAKIDKVLHITGLVITYAFLIFAAFIVILPFYYMIIGSFMQEADLISGKFWPVSGSFFQNIADNYQNTLARFDYFAYIGNTLIVAISTTALMLLVTIFSAFAFARLEFKGREFLFTIFLATMMIPGEMMVITNYNTMSNLGMISVDQTRLQAYFVMVAPFIASVFYIYLLRQNFKQIPNELYLASKVDGKSDWEYLWKVMVPLAAPTLITITILSIIGSWNAYVWPQIATSASRNPDKYWLISVAIRGTEALMLEDPNGIKITQYSWQMVASTLTVVPLLILFIIFRKYIMKGTGRAGIKG